MGTYYIPRNLKGESRLLYIFSMKALLTTAIGAGVGLLFFFLFRLMGLNLVGIIILAVFALIGYIVGTVKIPDVGTIAFFKKTGGESIDDLLIRYMKFKKSKKIYVYTKEEK